MTTPTSAVALRRSRRTAIASGEVTPVTRSGDNIGSSTTLTDPPLIFRGFTPSILPFAISASSRVPDPRIQERVGHVDEEVDDHERKGGDEREALHLLVVTGDDRVDPERAEARHGE